MMSKNWNPMPLEDWQVIFKDTNNEAIKDILRSWQYERDMIAWEIEIQKRAQRFRRNHRKCVYH